MRILILGGSGFLSSEVARTAVARGCDVTVLTRGQRSVPAGVKVLTVDRHDRAGFAREVASAKTDWDVVVDAIAYTPDDAEQDVSVFSGKAGRLVFVSTDFVYDPSHRKTPQSEHDATYVTEGYGGKKREAERILENTPAAVLDWTILRPSHIYGPGSLPGCLPLHGRDPDLIAHILANRPLRLVGGGRFLQHPIFAPDLAATILDAANVPAASAKILNVAGPEVLESQIYYRTFGRLLGRDVTIQEENVDAFLNAQPDKAPFCCDRVYDLSALRTAGIELPATPLEVGLRRLLVTAPKLG